MTPLELQRALASMPPRSAQTLLFRCVEGHTPAECAALYGIDLPQWEILFLDAARLLAGETKLLDDSNRKRLAPRLQKALTTDDPELKAWVGPLEALVDHRVEVERLLAEAERAAAQSPARNRETWLRRVAVVVIIAVSLFVWMRDRDKPPETPIRSR